MLYFTRWKAAAIMLTAFVVCLFAVPNFLPEKMVQSWPKWAQRHVVLGLDLQGGSHILLEVDSNAVRKEKLEATRDDVRRVLRDARVGYTGLVVRGNGVEVRIRTNSNFDAALAKLRELSQPLGGILSATGQRNIDVSTEAGNLVRLTLTDPAILERVRQSVEQSIQIIERRVIGAAEQRLEILLERHHVKEVPSLVEVNEQAQVAFFGSCSLGTGPEYPQPGDAMYPCDLPDGFGIFGREQIHLCSTSPGSRYPDDIRRDARP